MTERSFPSPELLANARDVIRVFFDTMNSLMVPQEERPPGCLDELARLETVGRPMRVGATWLLAGEPFARDALARAILIDFLRLRSEPDNSGEQPPPDVAWLSASRPKARVIMELLATLSEAPRSSLTTPSELRREQWTRLTKAAGALTRSTLLISDTPDASVSLRELSQVEDPLWDPALVIMETSPQVRSDVLVRDLGNTEKVSRSVRIVVLDSPPPELAGLWAEGDIRLLTRRWSSLVDLADVALFVTPDAAPSTAAETQGISVVVTRPGFGTGTRLSLQLNQETGRITWRGRG